MMRIQIFVEGGGETKAHGRSELRVAFDTLLGAQKEAARKKRMKWDTVFCGGRGEAADEFARALGRRRGEVDVLALLVDAEDEVASATPGHPTPSERRQHLERRDGWAAQLAKAAPEQVHLMTRCMEAWVFADDEKVAEFYGKDFRRSALPRRKLLDGEPKRALYAAIESATKGTTKGAYAKVQHASALLKRARPAVVAERCVSFGQFVRFLDSVIVRA
jgi:hypothetical protein